MTKTKAQLAYEGDVILTPRYHDGLPRKTWRKLGEDERWSWERNPTNRGVRATTVRRLVAFALHFRDSWHPFVSELATVEVVCAASNLKLVTLDGEGRFKAHTENAERYLSN